MRRARHLEIARLSAPRARDAARRNWRAPATSTARTRWCSPTTASSVLRSATAASKAACAAAAQQRDGRKIGATACARARPPSRSLACSRSFATASTGAAPLLDLFKALDRKREGFIGRDELALLFTQRNADVLRLIGALDLTALGLSSAGASDEVDEIFAHLDPMGVGVVDYAVFVDALRDPPIGHDFEEDVRERARTAIVDSAEYESALEWFAELERLPRHDDADTNPISDMIEAKNKDGKTVTSCSCSAA